MRASHKSCNLAACEVFSSEVTLLGHSIGDTDCIVRPSGPMRIDGDHRLAVVGIYGVLNISPTSDGTWASLDQPKKLLIVRPKPHDRSGEASGGLPWPRLENGGDGWRRASAA